MKGGRGRAWTPPNGKGRPQASRPCYLRGTLFSCVVSAVHKEFLASEESAALGPECRALLTDTQVVMNHGDQLASMCFMCRSFGRTSFFNSLGCKKVFTGTLQHEYSSIAFENEKAWYTHDCDCLRRNIKPDSVHRCTPRGNPFMHVPACILCLVRRGGVLQEKEQRRFVFPFFPKSVFDFVCRKGQEMETRRVDAGKESNFAQSLCPRPLQVETR